MSLQGRERQLIEKKVKLRTGCWDIPAFRINSLEEGETRDRQEECEN